MSLLLALGLWSTFGHASLTARLPVPLKLMTCELLLDPYLRKLSSTRDVRASLDYAIAHQTDKKLIERWTEIRAALDDGNPDRQIVPLELRGNEIEQAKWVLVDRSFMLRQTYDAELKRQFHPLVDLGAGTLNVVVAFALGGELVNVINGQVDPQAVMGALAVPGFVLYNLGVAHYHLSRFDWTFKRLRREIAANAVGSHPAALSTGPTLIPAEFHRGLMSAAGVSEQTRVDAIQTFGGPFGFVQVMVLRSLKKMKERVANANDVSRLVYVDHVFYFDEVKKESVWLAFYRARRGRRFGGRRRPHENAAQTGWSPAHRDAAADARRELDEVD